MQGEFIFGTTAGVDISALIITAVSPFPCMAFQSSQMVSWLYKQSRQRKQKIMPVCQKQNWFGMNVNSLLPALVSAQYQSSSHD